MGRGGEIVKYLAFCFALSLIYITFVVSFGRARQTLSPRVAVGGVCRPTSMVDNNQSYNNEYTEKILA